MAETDNRQLPQIYEEYLGGVAEERRPLAREALVRWNRFVEGRDPLEVDGTHRAWFEMTQEEQELGREQVEALSAEVGRFYDWLEARRPAKPPKPAGQPTPRSAPSGSSAAAALSPTLPPDRLMAPARPGVARPVESPPRRSIVFPILFVLGVLTAGAAFAFYQEVVAPVDELRAELRAYLDRPSPEAIGRLHEWLLPKAHVHGFEAGAEDVELTVTPVRSVLDEKVLRYELSVSMDLTQRVLWIGRELTISAEGVMERKPILPRAMETTPEGGAADPRVTVTKTPVPKLDSAARARIGEWIATLRSAINNYRITYTSTPAKSGELLRDDVAAVRAGLSEHPIDFRSAQIVGEVADALLELAGEEMKAGRIEDRLYRLEIKLREAERLLREELGGPTR